MVRSLDCMHKGIASNRTITTIGVTSGYKPHSGIKEHYREAHH